SIPLAVLNTLDPAQLSWGVPGMREELATELIRSLPKSTRTRFVPAKDWAVKALGWLNANNPNYSRPFELELSRALEALSDGPVGGWNADALPAHCRMGFQVTGGEEMEFGRDLAELQSRHGEAGHAVLQSSNPREQKSGTSWVFGEIPESVNVDHHSMVVTGYPYLSDDKTRVSESLETSLNKAQSFHRSGMVRLVCLALPEPHKWVVSHLSNAEKVALGSNPYPSVPDLLADARFAAVAGLCRDHDTWAVRGEGAFQNLVSAVRPDQVEATFELVKLAAEVLSLESSIRLSLIKLDQDSALGSDVTSQVDHLVGEGFLSATPQPWLNRLPIWLKAAQMRLSAAITDPAKDQQRMAELQPVLDAYNELLDEGQDVTDEMRRISYLIEEFRIQLFAQSLGTAEKVSTKRILAVINALR
ncbi:MAG: DUF3418 domain-containing protein, partial [Propionibacteriaceae bacterium]|nr:DUF3418 domain-containing protein [Propionibacteriaceae bacterium]